jgi:hypothetical protein
MNIKEQNHILEKKKNLTYTNEKTRTDNKNNKNTQILCKA